MSLGASLFVGTADATVSLVEREPVSVKRLVTDNVVEDVNVDTVADVDELSALVTAGSAIVLLSFVDPSGRAAYRLAQASAALRKSPS